MQKPNCAVNVGKNHDQTLRLLGKKIYVRKCLRPNPDGLVLAEQTRDRSNWCEVLGVGPACKGEIQVGDIVHVKETEADNRRWLNPLGAPYEAIIEEQNVEFILRDS